MFQLLKNVTAVENVVQNQKLQKKSIRGCQAQVLITCHALIYFIAHSECIKDMHRLMMIFQEDSNIQDGLMMTVKIQSFSIILSLKEKDIVKTVP